MFGKLFKLISKPQETAALAVSTTQTPPVAKTSRVRVSIPIANTACDKFENDRHHVFILTDKDNVSYPQILDAVCHIDPTVEVEFWKVENALDSVIMIDRDARGQFSKTIKPGGLQLPIHIHLENKEKVPTYIELTLE